MGREGERCRTGGNGERQKLVGSDFSFLRDTVLLGVGCDYIHVHCVYGLSNERRVHQPDVDLLHRNNGNATKRRGGFSLGQFLRLCLGSIPVLRGCHEELEQRMQPDVG